MVKWLAKSLHSKKIPSQGCFSTTEGDGCPTVSLIFKKVIMKYRKKPVVINATQWHQNGDHPKDDCEMIEGVADDFLSEGKIVRRFNHPDVPSNAPCPICRGLMRLHGWIDTLEGGHIVCAGDWIITGVKGEYYPCKPDIFDMTYEKV